MDYNARTPLLQGQHHHDPERPHIAAHHDLSPPLPNRGFLYPLYGIPYLLAHKSLHPPLRSRLGPLLILYVVVLSILFFFLYLPHVLILSFFHGPLAWVNAAFMILSEASTLVAIIAEAFMTEHQIIDVFDTIFVDHGFGNMVARCRVVGPNGELGEHKIYPYLKFKDSGRQTFWYIVELPINLIPIVGWYMFLCLQGWHLGRWQQFRYWQLMGYGPEQRKEMVKRNRWRYWTFGIVQVSLQMVPVLSIFFLFSTATGAGLWAVEAERRKAREGYGEEHRDEVSRWMRDGEGMREGMRSAMKSVFPWKR
ncbi:hypothetical protein CVT24_004661 [Panaeolus cyanescens]|uniref:Uncharacterized protein n=1 Tax=Panaeolus cyanescens TaxID=181874 RepID=A0A409YSF5_9AGAR|nr:hypothetical protein CVT24_004661 [Panaeolus cyanescens]